MNVKWNQIITGFVPHGLNHNTFKPLANNDPAYKQIFENIKNVLDKNKIILDELRRRNGRCPI